jgi:hypothetical protein
VPNSTGHMPLLRPTAVAVHDDGDVVGDGSHSFCVEMSSLTSGTCLICSQLLWLAYVFAI